MCAWPVTSEEARRQSPVFVGLNQLLFDGFRRSVYNRVNARDLEYVLV